ncbi:MAG: dihydropteroate synthase [Planctomycetota bacterium]
MTNPSPDGWRLTPAVRLFFDRPRVMTILNVTPDSFSDGGRLPTPSAVADAARRAVNDGADVLDIGGESTRPGAEPVPAGEQIRRVVPAIAAVRAAGIDTHITIDTTDATVALAALDAGATAVNDVSGGAADPAMLPLVAERGVGVVLMHRLTTSKHESYSDGYRQAPAYPDGVVQHVRRSLSALLESALAAGVAKVSVVLDPGLGFGKSVEQNLALLNGTPDLLSLGCPVLSGLSRKSFVGRVASPGEEQTAADDRLEGTLALTALHLDRGARLFRVHDTRAVRRAVDAAWALRAAHARTDP